MSALRSVSVAVLVLACMGACVRAPSTANAGEALPTVAAMQVPIDASTPVAPDAKQAPSPYAAEVKALGQIRDRFGFERKFVQVAPGLDDAQLVNLAKRLHALEPEAWFWMLDDGTQAAQMMEALPRTAQGDMQGYPADWVERHTVAHVVMELMPGGGKRWVLAKRSGSDVLAVLED